VDPLSQAVVGAIAAQSTAKSGELRAATVAGALGGMAADLDVLIRSADDPLLFLEYHRHFTHALAFIPVGGALVGCALWPLLRRHLSLSRLLWFATAGYATHGLLDACTSYGTRLLWPLSDTRVAWNTVAVVDPFVTLPLLALVVAAFVARSARRGRVAALALVVMMGIGLVQRTRADALLSRMIEDHGFVAVRQSAKPTLMNMIVWRGVVQHRGAADGGDTLSAVALRPGLFGPHRASVVTSAPRFVLERDLPDLPPDSLLAEDIARFAHFSDGWLVTLDDALVKATIDDALITDDADDERRLLVIGDFRYAALPDAVAPLWAIVVDPRHPEAHARYVTLRRGASGQLLTQLGCRLSGSCLTIVEDQR
jgi:inner membrane protein